MASTTFLSVVGYVEVEMADDYGTNVDRVQLQVFQFLNPVAESIE
jgi:hypothetical protein